MPKRWTYSGDRDLANGGTFFHITPDDFANGFCDAVRVTACSDGGGQENAWWVEALTVLIPDDEAELRRVLDSCGWTRLDLPPKGTAAYRRAVAEACVGYGKFDPANCYPEASSVTVQIGREAEVYGMPSTKDVVKPDVVLRSNASLERFVRNFMRRV